MWMHEFHVVAESEKNAPRSAFDMGSLALPAPRNDTLWEDYRPRLFLAGIVQSRQIRLRELRPHR
jgi:hypothetical protein